MFIVICVCIGVVAIATAGVGLFFIVTHERGERASGEHNFRQEGATRVTLPLRTQVHRDVRAAAWDRPHLWPDLPHAAPYRPDRLAVMAAEYEPPADLPGPEPEGALGIGQPFRAGEPALPVSAAPGPVSGGGELAPHVIRAFTRAGSEDTVITPHDLEPMIGGDPFDGLGSVDAYLDRLFTPPKPITWSAA